MDKSGIKIFSELFFLLACSANLISGSSPYVLIPGPDGNHTAVPLVNLGENFYYFENNVQTNWYAAIEFCRNIGLHLVAIETAEENQLIIDHIASIGFTNYWTSGSDLAESNLFVWSSTGKRVVFSDWHAGEPNDSRDDATINLSFKDGYLKWNDEDPNYLYNIICEKMCDAVCSP